MRAHHGVGRRRSAAAAVLMLVGVLVWPGSAGADVDRVAGSAFGASINSSVIGPVIPPAPAGVSGTASEPADGYGPIVQSALPIILPGILTVAALNASTQGGGLAGENHFGFATSSASVANVVVGVNALTANAITTTCRSDGDGSTGSTELVGATLAGNPLLQAPAANTVVQVPGILTAILNEQIVSDVPGDTSIIVRGVHILLLPGPLSPFGAFGALDIILAESRCNANGPNVNITTTTSTSTTTTTAPTTTTTAPTTTTTAPTTTTTAPTTTTTAPTTTTTAPTTTTTAPTTTTTAPTTTTTAPTTTTTAPTTTTTAPTTTTTAPTTTTTAPTTTTTAPTTTTTAPTTTTTAPTTTTTTLPPPLPGVCPSPLTPTGPIPAGYNRIVGTDDNERIFGTEGNDVIFGLGGNDEILGLGGNDIIFGGAGNDRLLGGSYTDFTGTTDGDDTLCGGEDNDQLFGQGGNDGLFGENGNDDLHGGHGDDFLAGGLENDRMFGGLGTNVLNGGGGQNFCQDPPPVYSNC